MDVRLPTATLSWAPGGCAVPGAERRGPPRPAASPSHKLSLPWWCGPGAAAPRFPFAPPWLLGSVHMSALRRAGGPGMRVRRAESAFCRRDAGAWKPPLPWAWGHCELGAARVTAVARSETPAGGHHRPGLDPCGSRALCRALGAGIHGHGGPVQMGRLKHWPGLCHSPGAGPRCLLWSRCPGRAARPPAGPHSAAKSPFLPPW